MVCGSFAFAGRDCRFCFYMSLFGGTSDGGASQQEALRQAQVTQSQNEIDKNFAGFTPSFFNQASADYTNAVTPGMLKDYQNTKNNLTYSLARAGNLKSSAAVQKNSSLQGQLSQNESQIANNAQNQSNTLQANVNTQKGQLIEQATAGTDPTAINEQAQGAASQLRAPSAIAPLGNLFENWSNQYLAGQASSAYTTPGTQSIWEQLGNGNYGTFPGASTSSNGGGAGHFVN